MKDYLRLAARAGVLLLLVWVGATVSVVLAVRWVAPPTTAVMIRDAAGGTSIDYRWTDSARISRYAALAAIAAEDQKFMRHNGFDIAMMRQAIADYRDGRPLRGASTISQQVAKNLFLWHGRSFLRKGLEAYFTLLIEASWPKERILEVYLNIAELGPGVYGVGAAAEAYFGKPAESLTATEAALLAAVLPNPAVLRADAPSTYVRQRQDWIARQMRLLQASGGVRGLSW